MTNLPVDCDVVKSVKKLARRLLTVLAILLGVMVAVCTVGVILYRHTPQWYQLPKLTAEEFEAAAQRAHNKLALIHNEAARIRTAERANRASTSPATDSTAPNVITVTFTDHELNALFNKWSVFNDWKAAYERYLTDPVIILNNGRIIFAARVTEMNTVASVHFRPRIDDDGQLHLDLVRILAGHLPLPEMVLSDYHQRLESALEQRLPRWRANASLDRSGAPNTAAVCATMGALAVKVLQHQPSAAILFLPLVEHGSVAVKLVDVKIENHTITLTVQPLTTNERAILFKRIKQPGAGAAP